MREDLLYSFSLSNPYVIGISNLGLGRTSVASTLLEERFKPMSTTRRAYLNKSLTALGAVLALSTAAVAANPAMAGHNPCHPAAVSSPCGAANPCSAWNPCAAKNPRTAANPCAAHNPCSATNPCAATSKGYVARTSNLILRPNHR